MDLIWKVTSYTTANKPVGMRQQLPAAKDLKRGGVH
jgi:hypothetical protein